MGIFQCSAPGSIFADKTGSTGVGNNCKDTAVTECAQHKIKRAEECMHLLSEEPHTVLFKPKQGKRYPKVQIRLNNSKKL